MTGLTGLALALHESSPTEALCIGAAVYSSIHLLRRIATNIAMRCELVATLVLFQAIPKGQGAA
jgi:hypothetical protein